jgi:hypothetical protein
VLGPSPIVGLLLLFSAHGEDGGGKPGRSYSLYDQASNLLTNLLNPGGSGNMPVAEGAVSDLFGRPLFFALYDWFMEVRGLRPGMDGTPEGCLSLFVKRR